MIKPIFRVKCDDCIMISVNGIATHETNCPTKKTIKACVSRFKMSEEEYSALDEEYSGLCDKCGEVRYGDTEPDAENYPCEACGENSVQGIINLLAEGRITFV